MYTEHGFIIPCTLIQKYTSVITIHQNKSKLDKLHELCKEQFWEKNHFLIQQFYELKIIPFPIESNLQYQMVTEP